VYINDTDQHKEIAIPELKFPRDVELILATGKASKITERKYSVSVLTQKRKRKNHHFVKMICPV
jgi:hypothetical protein